MRSPLGDRIATAAGQVYDQFVPGRYVAEMYSAAEDKVGSLVVSAGINVAKSLFKKKAKKAVARVASNVASNLLTDAVQGVGQNLINRYTGGGGPQFPAIPPATFGFPGTPNVPSIISTGLDIVKQYQQGGGGKGTYVGNHPGTIVLADGTIWKGGKLYIMRQNGRLQHVTRDKFGNIIPASKRMNVLNPHALSRSMRRVQGFHTVATAAIKHMEKWAAKSTRSHRGRKATLPRGKKR